jgi:Peptidoglycan-binding protein, CsiV
VKRTIVYGLSVIIAVVSQGIFAESGKYQIEMLVFSQGPPTTEVFDQTESKIQWPTALTELSAYQQTDNKALKEGIAELLKDGVYQPIANLAWTQSTGPGGAILPVHIQSTDGNLDGFMHIRNTQQFELIVDLEQKSTQTDRSGKPYLYRLHEKRPIKLNEIQYFDHPKVGVLVRINNQ